MRCHALLLFLFVAALGCAESQKMTIKVCDALTSKSLEDAQVTLYVSHPPKAFFESRWCNQQEFKGNENALVEISYPNDEGLKSSVFVHKKGYYRTWYNLPRHAERAQHMQIIELIPKQRPISLIAIDWTTNEQTFSYRTPRDVKYYDCLKADWLPPHGEGTKADIEFSLQQYRKDGKDFAWFKIRFTNPNDGVEQITKPYAGDMFIREAPLIRHPLNQIDIIEECQDGYPKKLPPERNYAFRVRTQMSPSGELLSAYYGKFYQAFRFHTIRDYWTCGFGYYVNPTPNDRNLEYNGKSLNALKNRVQRIRHLR